MVICILISDEHIESGRESAKSIPQFSKHTALAIPVSSSGDAPPTHWFCSFNASEEVYQQIKELQQFSEVVESAPRPFLESKELKIISLKNMKAWYRDNR